MPGESTAKILVVVVPGVSGGTRLAASLANAFMNGGVAGRTVVLSAAVKPQVLNPVTDEVLDPPARNANAPSGEYEIGVRWRGEGNLLQRVLRRPHI